jgi:hypothetical protein
MTLNPFIELARDPVGVLAWLGYVALLMSLLLSVAVVAFMAVPWSLRKGARLVHAYYRDRRSDDWWSLGESPVGYIPPGSWLIGLFKIGMVYVGLTALIGVSAMALSALFWLVGV